MKKAFFILTLLVATAASAKINHPEVFWQAENGENVLDFGFDFANIRSRSDDGSTAVAKTWATTSRVKFQKGFSDQFAFGVELRYLNAKESGEAPVTTVKGFEDVRLSANFAFPSEVMKFYVGGTFFYSAQDSHTDVSDSGAYSMSAFSGGHSVGLNGGFSAEAPYGQAGVRVDYRHFGNRLMTIENSDDLTITGGNTLQLTGFYEYDLDGIPLGFTLSSHSKASGVMEVAGNEIDIDAFSKRGAGVYTKWYWEPEIALIPEVRWWTAGSPYKVYDQWESSLFFRWSL